MGHLLLRLTRLGAGRNPRWLLVAAIAWALYAAWEWLILVRTPEANIRVDLLLIWPVLALLSAWALFRLFRSRDAASGRRGGLGRLVAGLVLALLGLALPASAEPSRPPDLRNCDGAADLRGGGRRDLMGSRSPPHS